jgi:hypothetical protein
MAIPGYVMVWCCVVKELWLRAELVVRVSVMVMVVIIVVVVKSQRAIELRKRRI